jgi:D-arabinose 1-dehydrogenase-like Zn-dependent alcohol dehydrogenase
MKAVVYTGYPAADVNLVGLPDAVDFVTAACLGCRFATAFRALTAHGRLRAGDWLAVHGCGGAGLSAVLIGAALGARVIAVDVAPVALDRARELGADQVIDAAPGQVADPVTGQVIGLSGAPSALAALGQAPAVAGMTVIDMTRPTPGEPGLTGQGRVDPPQMSTRRRTSS